MVYKGPFVCKLTYDPDTKTYLISRNTKRFRVVADSLAFDALVSAKENYEGDSLLEHWVDGKWQSRQKA